MDSNVIHVQWWFIDWVIYPIYFSAGSFGIGFIASLGFLGGVWAWWLERRGKAFDQFAISRVLIESSPGSAVSLVKIRNLDSVGRFYDQVRGVSVRKMILAWARRCTIAHPFIITGSDAQQRIMHDVIRDSLTKLCTDGEIADMAGIPIVRKNICYSVTAAETVGADETFKIRVHCVEEETLRQFLPANRKWKFEKGEDRQHRAQIYHQMAVAHFGNGDRIDCNKRSVRILESFELAVRQ